MATMATPEMAAYCFSVILAKLQNAPTPTCSSDIPNTPSPIFVTFKYVSNNDLRGCMGSFAFLPLHEQLHNIALVAAFKDRRFSPISLNELPQLMCTVSLLNNFETCSKWNDWVIGTHGIWIKNKQYSSTYLPSVAVEQGFNHLKTVKSLLAKGGYHGPVDEKVLSLVQVVRYQVSCTSITFEDTKLLKV
ncbi:unnamed protein product [Phytomonas sp. EM1]|nr:unnamed protein product [Phytomonas sp. EM1]|eukprot:CCW62731.1 unnamed protein product [Phytomonas sp. isolate EM1]